MVPHGVMCCASYSLSKSSIETFWSLYEQSIVHLQLGYCCSKMGGMLARTMSHEGQFTKVYGHQVESQLPERAHLSGRGLDQRGISTGKDAGRRAMLASQCRTFSRIVALNHPCGESLEMQFGFHHHFSAVGPPYYPHCHPSAVKSLVLPDVSVSPDSLALPSVRS